MDLPDWVQRSVRAYLNMLENLPVFAAIVLVVHSSGAANVTTALGAQIFFWGRVAMAVGHMGGIPGLRLASCFGAWLASSSFCSRFSRRWTAIEVRDALDQV